MGRRILLLYRLERRAKAAAGLLADLAVVLALGLLSWLIAAGFPLP